MSKSLGAIVPLWLGVALLGIFLFMIGSLIIDNTDNTDKKIWVGLMSLAIGSVLLGVDFFVTLLSPPIKLSSLIFWFVLLGGLWVIFHLIKKKNRYYFRKFRK